MLVLTTAAACWALTVLSADVTAAPQPATGSADVSRADLVWGFYRFERTRLAHPPEGPRIAEANRDFDRLARAFLRGGLTEALEKLNQLTDSLRPVSERRPEWRHLESWKVRLQPSVFVPGKSASAQLHLSRLYTPNPPLPALAFGPASPLWTLRLRNLLTDELGPSCRLPASLFSDLEQSKEIAWTISLPQDVIPTSPGMYLLEIGLGDGPGLPLSQFQVCGESPAAVRARLTARLAKIPTQESLQSALTIASARLKLLQDTPSEEETAEFLTPQAWHGTMLAQELERLERGENPYANRPGEHWRVIPTARLDIPCWVYAPPHVLEAAAEAGRAGRLPARSLPLIVAMHGAGGDESMFLRAYGNGLIRKLADQEGFLLALPQTYYMLGFPEHLDALIRELSRDYPVDPERITLIGHSLGAITASGLSRSRPESLAGVVCLAGSNGNLESNRRTPLRLICGKLDPLFPYERLAEQARVARAAGAPVTFDLHDDYGHTLLVDHVLPEVVPWLLQQRLSKPAPASK